jgi:hypothetical protein
MDRFPSEFDLLLNARGRKLFADPPSLESLIARRRTPIVFFEGIIDRDVANDCIRLLDESMYSRLRRMHTPIPREALTGMTENYGEQLRKTVRVKTVTINSRTSKALDAAREIGLDAMMSSASFRRCAQAVTRLPLRDNFWARQVICYDAGDYSGPHNDHHPERPEARNGFIDFHVMFSNASVAHQPSIAVYRLPFWHYTTPLVAREGREHDARRWLLLGSFDYDPPLACLEY